MVDESLSPRVVVPENSVPENPFAALPAAVTLPATSDLTIAALLEADEAEEVNFVPFDESVSREGAAIKWAPAHQHDASTDLLAS